MSTCGSRSRPRVTVKSYRDDKLYLRVAQAVEQILAKGKVVAPVDVLVQMGILDPKRYEDWRRGRVPYLEKVIHGNLTRLSRLLRILRFHAHDLNLTPSVTAYMRWGKGPRQRLRFTKTGDLKVEEAYARHFVWPGKGPFHPPLSKQELQKYRATRRRRAENEQAKEKNRCEEAKNQQGEQATGSPKAFLRDGSGQEAF